MVTKATEKGLQVYMAQRKAGMVREFTPAEKAAQNPKSFRCAINAKCWDCTCYQKKEVTRCVMVKCPLWKMRPWQNEEINEMILTGEMK